MPRKTRRTGDGTFVNAILAGIRDLRHPQAPDVNPVPDQVRIDGKTCLVTGANSGLGRAAAVELAKRGGNMNVEMMDVDLADLESVHRFCDRLRERGIRIDIALMNAGLMSRRSRKTPQGYELMFAVHFLSKRVMIDRWLRDGVITPSGRAGKPPRIVFIASESHRSSHAIDFERFGAFTEFGIRESLKYYGLSKLVLCTFAAELSRRLNPAECVNVAVHAMCPGGVDTNISRDTPMLLRPIVKPVLRHFFQSPEEAIGPVVYLCCAEQAGRATGMYLHMMRRKPVSRAASDPGNGVRLWEESEALMEKLRQSR